MIRNKYFLPVCLFMLHALLHGQHPRFRHYTLNDGLASGTVYYAMQDNKGYMWFCTESGVNRFDGGVFETFTINDGLADNENFKSYQDSRGRIWFLSYNGQLSYYYDTGFVNRKMLPSLQYTTQEGKYLSDMLEDRKGNIWFSLFESDIYCYNGRNITLHTPEQEHLSGKILFNTINGISTLTKKPALYSYNLSQQKHHAITTDNNDWGIGYTWSQQVNNQLYFLSTEGIKFLRHDSLFTALKNSDLGTGIQTCKIIGHDLWVGSNTDGLYIIRNFMSEGYKGSYEHFLEHSSISCIVPDHEQGIWICTLSDGVYYLPASAVFTSEIPDRDITCISHNTYNDMYALGNYYAGLSIYKNGVLHKTHHFIPQNGNRIKAVQWLPGNNLLVGNDYNLSIYYTSSGVAKNITDSKLTGFSDMDGDSSCIWISGRHDIFLYHRGKAETVSEGTGERLVSIASDGIKGCWFASIQKLYYFNYSTHNIELLADAEKFNANMKDLRYVNGCLWVATDGNGIFIFRDNKPLRHIVSANSALTSNICRELEYDGKGQMWVSTAKGICIFDIHSFVTSAGISTANILSDKSIRDIELHAGKLYAVTQDGVAITAITSLNPREEPPRVYIKSFSTGGKTYALSEEPEWEYSNGITKISYTAITFQAHDELLYRYKMAGKDALWNETHADDVEFYNLPPGDYTILISARKQNSGWSNPVSYTFTILPLWYQSNWFKIAIVVILAVFIYLLFRMRIKNIRKREAEKTSFNQRIAELKGNALASQMNPHFIFNAVNAIQHFIFNRDELAANEYLAKFSKLIRMFLESSRKKYVSLGEEMELLKLYTDLEKLRFEDKFNIEISVDPLLHTAKTEMPSMLVQPFVENAINHGLVYLPGNGKLYITFTGISGGLLCVVDDNGIGRAKHMSMKKEGHISRGISLVTERLESYAAMEPPMQCSIDIRDKTNADGMPAGTAVIITILYLS